MNTTDILKRFVDLAPPEWKPRIRTGTVFLTVEGSDYWINPYSDSDSAYTIIFLEGQLGTDYLMSTISNAKGIVGYRYQWGAPGEKTQETHGKTRIEALVRACIDVQEAKAVPA